MNLLVVTSPKLGWDCVVAVYESTSDTLDDIGRAYPHERGYVITEIELSKPEDLD